MTDLEEMRKTVVSWGKGFAKTSIMKLIDRCEKAEAALDEDAYEAALCHSGTCGEASGLGEASNHVMEIATRMFQYGSAPKNAEQMREIARELKTKADERHPVKR